jgi:ADP-ribose pyrophosphatase
MDRPFTRIDREVLISNQWHRYCRDRYVQGDGSEGVYYYIDMAGSCATIPIFEDGSTMLVRVDRYVLGLQMWEFPIGGMNPGDQPLAVAKRELLEETGLLAMRWTELGHFAPCNGVSNELCHFFVARGITVGAQELEPSERITMHRMPFATARRRLLEQECGHGQSLAGLMLLERWLAQGNEL